MTPSCQTCRFQQPYDEHLNTPRMCCATQPRHEIGFQRQYGGCGPKALLWEKK